MPEFPDLSGVFIVVEIWGHNEPITRDHSEGKSKDEEEETVIISTSEEEQPESVLYRHQTTLSLR